MKKSTLILALLSAFSLTKAQTGLQGIVVEKYYSSTAADSVNADANGSVTPLRKGSVTYRVYVDMAPGYKFTSLYGGVNVHPLIIKTTTNFYNDPVYGQIYPQGNSLVNTRKNTTLIDSWLSVGGVCAGKMGVPKNEDTDGSIGNTSGALTNTLGAGFQNNAFGVAINSVVAANAQDGLAPGSPLIPNGLGLGSSTDVFDQTPGALFTCTSCAVAALGGAVGTTTSNMVLVGQFTTNGVLCFSLNVQVSNTVTNIAENYVPSNPETDEFAFAGLSYCSATTPTIPPVDTSDVSIKDISTLKADITVYPNPSKGMFTLTAANLNQYGSFSYSVFDVAGRMILASSVEMKSSSYSENIDITAFDKGLYFVKVSVDGLVSTRKIVKE
jgi:hypothetical protein